MTQETHWKELADFQPDKTVVGFIYRITNTVTGERYIGKKSFWSKIKGKTVESNWRKYRSSNDTVKGWDAAECEFEVLDTCHSKYELSYMEIWWLMTEGALLSESYLNYMLGSQTIGRCPSYMRIK